ncbi:LPXTG-site transpeptidase (sortase) family protein [Sinosporangium album]|uniref:LPXTG-site transpeptidase (Sortase) family protein n=1 Tax=Sinosporangium album TaxID=504805 RepID=A0A1G8J5P1_9ACTN|nr:class F sortase [Sinosporangium album]SDI26569.1 LPXTG-site transpeptidase (sortase) family protein [Sinosporangium album]
MSGIDSGSAFRSAGPDKTPRGRLIAALLVAGSLGTIAVIMAALLTYLAPPAPQPDVQADGAELSLTNMAEAGYFAPVVGPGGPGVLLTAAQPSAPPPAPAVRPVAGFAKNSKVRPSRIVIPSIGVSAPLTSLGLQPSGAVQAPSKSRPNLAGWYKHGPEPGETGPAVILGHVSTKRGAAVFNRVKDLQKGRKIRVVRSNGTVAEFTVSGIEQVRKDAFPTQRVYGNVNRAELRLVTCGGVLNAKDHSYSDNIIVYATLSAKRAR